MKVLIMSDSHGRDAYMARAIQKSLPIDLIIHLGDLEGDEGFLRSKAPCPVEMVAGNNDLFTDLPQEKVIRIGRHQALLTHGHRYRLYQGTDGLKRRAREAGADIVMFGHTHMPLVDQTGPVIALNPGSVTQPRQEGRRPSYIVMETGRDGEARFAIHYL